MENLSDNDVKLLVAGVGVICALIGFFGRGLAFMAKRRLTKSKRQEDASYMASIVDIGARLKASGMTAHDIKEVLNIVRSPGILTSEAAVEVVTGPLDETTPSPYDLEPSPFETNYAMKMRTGSSIGVAEAELTQVLTDLEILVGENEWAAMEKTQLHWAAYRSALQDYAYMEYEGGTHAGLAAGLVALAETERRTAEVRADVDERKRRRGLEG